MSPSNIRFTFCIMLEVPFYVCAEGYVICADYFLRMRRKFTIICVFQLRGFLAHLSQRLIGELIGYSWSGVLWSAEPFVRRRQRRRPQCSKIFFSETPLPIKAKFYVEAPWVGRTIFCHMTKMAATPIYGKNHSKIFSRTGRPISTKLGM